MILFSTCFLSPLCEVLLALNGAAMICIYLILKHLMFANRERPPLLGPQIGDFVVIIFPFAILLVELGGILFNIWVDEDFNLVLYLCIQLPCAIATIVLFLLFIMITPILNLVRLCPEALNIDEMDEDEYKYEYQLRNLDHYDFENPLTQEMAKSRPQILETKRVAGDPQNLEVNDVSSTVISISEDNSQAESESSNEENSSSSEDNNDKT